MYFSWYDKIWETWNFRDHKGCSNNFNLSETISNGLSVILCEFEDHWNCASPEMTYFSNKHSSAEHSTKLLSYLWSVFNFINSVIWTNRQTDPWWAGIFRTLGVLTSILKRLFIPKPCKLSSMYSVIFSVWFKLKIISDTCKADIKSIPS